MSAAGCPDCGSIRLDSLGPLPDAHFFAGGRLHQAMPGGELLHCTHCDLRFRHPIQASAHYEALYDNARVDVWQARALRRDQALVKAFVERQPGELRLLDFGCYSGEFLASLPSRISRFGVEINAAAAAFAARETGATVERSLDDFSPSQVFDVIVAMDVIEHVVSPRALVAQLVARLAPNGRLVITTGDGANWLWRALGARWWYCYFPEHIAFLSQSWIEVHAPALGVHVVALERFNYLRRSWRDLVRRSLGVAAYVLMPGWHAARRKVRRRQLERDDGVPGQGLLADHLLIALQRPHSSSL